jgi:hypothetical protein
MAPQSHRELARLFAREIDRRAQGREARILATEVGEFLGFDLVETVWAMEWLIPRLMVTEDETPDGVMVSGQYTSEPLRLTEAGKAFARRGEVPRGW